jgi:hypothetical protein
MPVTMPVVLRAMAHHSYGHSFPECLQKAQRKLLPMIPDRRIPPVNRSGLQQFLAITTPKVAPADPARLKISQQLFTRTQICHPDVVARGRQTPATETADKNPQSVSSRINWRKDRFRLNHSSPLKARSRMAGTNASSSAAVSVCRRFSASTSDCTSARRFCHETGGIQSSCDNS